MPRKNSPRSRLEDARARMYHDLLLESAETVFGENGFAGATMQAIASEAGVSTKTLYATYPSKQDLYDEVMTSRGQEFLEETREAMGQHDDPVDAMAAGIRAYVGFLLDHEDWLQIHLRARVAWAFQPGGESTARAWEEGIEAIASVIRAGQEAGVFADGDAFETSILVQALMQVQMARAAESGDRDAAAIADRILLHVGRLLGAAPELLLRRAS